MGLHLLFTILYIPSGEAMGKPWGSQAQEAAEGQQEEDLSKALEGAQVRRLSE